MELEPSANISLPPQDRRPLVPEPLPVRILSVEDVTLLAPPGLEPQLNDFYLNLLKFERDERPGLVYRSDNFCVKFKVIETERESLRPLLIEVPRPRLTEIEHGIVDRKLEYTRLKGVTPGEQRLAVRDPAGNWVEIVEFREI